MNSNAIAFDVPPKTADERDSLAEAIRLQLRSAIRVEAITCPCGFSIPHPWTRSYRCFYCGVTFCRRCAERHFAVEERQK